MRNDTVTTKSVVRGLVDVEQDFILYDTARTKTVFKAQLSESGIRGWLYRYKKDNNGNCEEIVPTNFNQLHANDSIRIELHSEAVSTLYQRFTELARLLEEQGILYGENEFAITNANELIINEKNKADVIRKLLDGNFGEEVWAKLAEKNPDIATRLANSQLQTDRAAVVSKFEEMLCDNSLIEDEWQDFFEANTWIFGYGLRYQILRVVQIQPNYGGTNVSGKGGQRGDFLTATEAALKFTCLVEIKKPTTPLLQNTEYRNGAWGVSSELSGAVSQVQVNCAKWEITGSREDDNRDLMGNIHTIAPKGIVVIGSTCQLSNRDKRNAFERYRNEMHNPEIITYDELYQRARFIVGEVNPLAK